MCEQGISSKNVTHSQEKNSFNWTYTKKWVHSKKGCQLKHLHNLDDLFKAFFDFFMERM